MKYKIKEPHERKRPARPGEGRPTKYSEEMLRLAWEYLEQCTDEIYDYVTGESSSDKSSSTSWQQKVRVRLPTIEGLCLKLQIDETTAYDWGEQNPEFSITLKTIKRKQKEMLIAGGVSGLYNPLITKLVLAANHGMSDKTEIDHTSKGKQINGVGVILSKAYGDDTDEDAGEAA